LRAALDQCFAPLHSAIGGAREVALFPPVTGG
jgi:molybdopterin synthase sulfur carrier subunit